MVIRLRPCINVDYTPAAHTHFVFLHNLIFSFFFPRKNYTRISGRKKEQPEKREKRGERYEAVSAIPGITLYHYPKAYLAT